MMTEAKKPQPKTHLEYRREHVAWVAMVRSGKIQKKRDPLRLSELEAEAERLIEEGTWEQTGFERLLFEADWVSTSGDDGISPLIGRAGVVG